MSLGSDGRRILCDGTNCEEQTSVPVALPVLPSGAARRQVEPSENWLYVRLNGVWRHYCPKCAVQYHLTHADGLEPIANEK